MDFNLYSLFRLMLTAVTVYNLVDLVRTLLRFKPYYDRLPASVKRFLFRQIQAQLQQPPAAGNAFLFRKLQEHRRDFVINSVLLVLLMILNGALYFI